MKPAQTANSVSPFWKDDWGLKYLMRTAPV
jgi:hypothetical protein